MILTPEVLTIVILDVVFAFFGMIAFVLSIKIFLGWDINLTTPKQYTLEKQSYLGATIIKYIFAIKVPLFLFFIFTLDKISNVITGAMCAAGVVDATVYGTYLLVFKIINIYLFAYWLVLHHEDTKYENQPYTKLKFGIFIVAFLFLVSELILEWSMFTSIDIDKIVSCCGTLYSSSATSAISSILKIKSSVLIGAFYINFFAIVLFYIFKRRYLFALANIVFVPLSLISLIAFFGTYIYELPTHHCPFCFLQSDYYYVGYLIYTLLFVGTFYGLVVGFIQNNAKRNYKISIFFDLCYVILVSLYPVVFYIKNGVWL